MLRVTNVMDSLLDNTLGRPVTGRPLLRTIAEVGFALPEDMLLPWVEKRMHDAGVTWEGTQFMLKMIKELKGRWNQFHPNVRKRFIENMFGNLLLFSKKKHEYTERVLGDWPMLMVISPTMRCNLKCIGCYSANYSQDDVISTEQFDRILTEAEELGIYFVVVSGGEPYMRRDLLDMMEKHNGMLFMTYTNSTIIYNKKLAPRLAEMGNVMPAISVEGFQAETDYRRGKGVYHKVVSTMEALRDAGVMFGFSATPMRHNNEVLVSDRFIDYYLEKGVFFGWYFNYVPIGRDPDPELMPTPQQRLHRYNRIREIRATRPILAADFWTDGPLTHGCLSSGRTYFHINSFGGVEPCVFHQFSVDNILDKPLIEVLNSPYFRHMRQQVGSERNLLRPCPIIDRPYILRRAVEKYHSKPSQPGFDALLYGDTAKALDKYAMELKKTFDPVWEHHVRREQAWSASMPKKVAQKNPMEMDPKDDLADLEPSRKAIAGLKGKLKVAHMVKLPKVTVKIEKKEAVLP